MMGSHSSMKILFIVPYVPNRIRVRSFQIIKNLVGHGHQVTLVSLWGSRDEIRDLQELNLPSDDIHLEYLSKLRSAWNCVKALPTSTPLQAVYCWEPKLTAVLTRLLDVNGTQEPFDLIHVEHLRGALYGLWVKEWLESQGRYIPVVWDSVDCISLLFARAAQHSQDWFGRWVTRFELPRSQRMERSLLHAFERVLVTSREDAGALRALVRDEVPAPIVVLPNGVDLEYFSPGDPDTRQAGQLVISGKMSYHANISMALHFVNNILPAIRAQHPGVELWIVGKDPPAEIRRLVETAGVHVTGTVPDLRPYLQKASIAVAPLTYAVGIQNKVLEAMACATPVVLSKEAAGGFRFESEDAAWIAEDDTEFSLAVSKLISDRSLRDQTGAAGRRFVEQHHAWGQIVTQLEDVYRELINTPGE